MRSTSALEYDTPACFSGALLLVDTPSPEGRAKSLGEDDIERIVLAS